MTKRIFRYILACTMLIFFTTISMTGMISYGVIIDEKKENVSEEIEYISIGVEREGTIYLNKLPKNEDFVLIFDVELDRVYSNRRYYTEYLELLETDEHYMEYLLDGEYKNTKRITTSKEEVIFYAKVLENGTILCVISAVDSMFAIISKFATLIILAVVTIVISSAVVSMKIAKKITNPINAINLENPNKASIYEELSPFIMRITEQNEQIRSHIKDLSQQQQAFKTITSNMIEGLFLLDDKGEILSCNGGALHIMGISEQPTNQNILVLNRTKDFMMCVEGAIAGKRYEKVVEFDDKIFNVFANPVWEDDTVKGVVLMLVDVTEREQREAIRRQFSANVSHELKTPLTSISGFAEIMKNGMVKPEDIEKFSGKIYDESQRLIRLVHDIIKISRLDEQASNNNEYEKVDINMDLLVKEIIARLEPIAKKDGIDIKYQGYDCIINGNPQIIQEVVYNLCDNAIRYNKKDGHIKIYLKNQCKDVLLTVEDTGIGINKKHQSRIFERFYRISQSRSKVIDGTGLGLSIVKHGVLLHHGSINVESDFGKGTRIRVRLPQKVN